MIKYLGVGIGAACLCASAHAAGQTLEMSDLRPYEPGQAVKKGFSAQELSGAEVRGKNGEKIGEVEELIIGPDSQLRRLVVAVNEGFFGSGGRRLAVDFDDVSIKGTGVEVDYITVPVTERNVEEHGVFEDKQASIAGKPREWRASELLGDYVSLEDVENYGSVHDLVFDQQGQLRMIATSPDFGRTLSSSFLAPYGPGESWQPGEEYYVLPYTQSELSKLLPPKTAASESSAPNAG